MSVINIKTDIKDHSPPENQRNNDLSGVKTTNAKINPAEYDEQYGVDRLKFTL